MKRVLPTFLAMLMEMRFRLVYSLGGKVVGARALVVRNQQVLLVSHTYNEGWYTIGGVVEKGESPFNAIKRELIEEAGINVTEKPKLINVYHSLNRGKDDYVFFYCVEAFNESTFSSFEIEEARWFSLDNLPKDITPATKRRIEEYMGTRKITDQW